MFAQLRAGFSTVSAARGVLIVAGMSGALGDQYVLGELIGSGGMGQVYAAEQPCRARTVAVKLMRAELTADTHMLRRFHTEAIVGSCVSHPNLVSVLDHGHARDGTPYLVMELVRGRTLSAILAAEGPLPICRASRIVLDLLAGLAELHTAGIVHGDVKTDNLIIDQGDGRERARLIDFGLARFIEDERIGGPVMSGTPEYLAPELILGGTPTIASDLYGVGIVLYELLTGTTPFAGESLDDVLARQLEEDVVAPSLRCERYVPYALEAIVMRALAKAPLARYASARELAQALAAATPAREVPLARGTRPIFSTEATTRSFARSFARGTNPFHRDPVALRVAIDAAIDRDDVADVIATSLELARVLVDQEQISGAATEITRAIDVVSHGEGVDAPDAPDALWRLLLTLAALHDGLGDRTSARRAALAAHAFAESRGNHLGCERARTLLDRLLRSRP